MNEKDWTILKTIYEENNITKAAEKLFITQPALTYRLKQMEEEVGIQILRRNNKGIQFTPKGEYLVTYAGEMLERLQKTKDHLMNMNEDEAGIIRLGVASNFAGYLLPDILKSFLDKYRNVQFSVFTGWSYNIIKQLEQGRANLGIVKGDVQWHHQSVLLNTESICVISSSPIQLHELPKLPRIIFDTDPKLKHIIDSWWYDTFPYPPKVMMEIDNIDTCKKLVAKGLGYAIVPSSGLTSFPNLKMLQLLDKNGSPLKRMTWLLYKESELHYPIVKKFIKFLIDYSQYRVDESLHD